MLDSNGLGQKRSPALLGGERGFGKLKKVFLRKSLSDTDRLTAHQMAKDKVAFGLTVMDGTHGLSIGTERPQTQS